MEAYVGNQLRYRTGTLSDERITYAGIGWHLISLHPFDSGIVLSLRIASDYQMIVIRERILIGDRSTLVAAIIVGDIGHLFIKNRVRLLLRASLWFRILR